MMEVFRGGGRLPLPLEINKGICEGMTLVGDVTFFVGSFPVERIEPGEEGIGMGGRVVDYGQAQAVGHRQSLAIDAGTAYDEHLLTFGA